MFDALAVLRETGRSMWSVAWDADLEGGRAGGAREQSRHVEIGSGNVGLDICVRVQLCGVVHVFSVGGARRGVVECCMRERCGRVQLEIGLVLRVANGYGTGRAAGVMGAVAPEEFDGSEGKFVKADRRTAVSGVPLDGLPES